MDGLNLWPVVDFRLLVTLLLGQQEQLQPWKQLDAYNYFTVVMCRGVSFP